MDNPDDEKIIVNVKGVHRKTWDRAKTAAERNDETMGEWINRAINQLADAEAGGRLIAPDVPPVKPDATPPDLMALYQTMAHVGLLARDTGRPPPARLIGRLYAMAETLTRAALGLPPRQVKAPPTLLLRREGGQREPHGG